MTLRAARLPTWLFDVAKLAALAGRFARDRRGGVALIFALSIPAVLGGAGTAVEYTQLASKRTKLQQAVDGAALTAARELVLTDASDSRISSVAQDVFTSTLAASSGAQLNPAPSVTATVTDKRRGVQVDAAQDVTSVFGRFLTYPTYKVSVTAAARLTGMTKLCVLTLERTANAAFGLDKNARISADDCSAYSNSSDTQGLIAKDSSYLRAARICTVGGYYAGAGNISTAPITDCPVYDDPLSSRTAPTSSSLCDQTALVVSVTRTLLPGTYCKGLKIDGGTVSLMPGTYVISGGPLVVTGGATLSGDGVGFYLSGDQATFDFRPDSTISLAAPKSGSMAGLLFFEDRAAPLLRTHNISSKAANRLLGTFYLSRGLLKIDTNSPVADQSAYTVIVARQLQLTSSPNLVMNAMYTSSDVPVPEGVGPNGSKVSLSR